MRTWTEPWLSWPPTSWQPSTEPTAGSRATLDWPTPGSHAAVAALSLGKQPVSPVYPCRPTALFSAGSPQQSAASGPAGVLAGVRRRNEPH